MKLIGTYPSPFVRKARIVLAEKKIDYEFVIDSPWVASNTISLHNPLGNIPVLILDDETVVYDSRVIVEHLDNGAPNNKLIPQLQSLVRHSGLPYIAIPNAPTIPSNAIAATVRTAFGWA